MMVEHVPEQPEGEIAGWEELRDPELDPGMREDMEALAKIDEEAFWRDHALIAQLEDPRFAPSLWLGYRLLLEAHGLDKTKNARERFEGLADIFLGNTDAAPPERAQAARDIKKLLRSFGMSERELSAKETLRRAYWGMEQGKGEEGTEVLKKIAEEDPHFRGALSEFDRQARAREEENHSE